MIFSRQVGYVSVISEHVFSTRAIFAPKDLNLNNYLEIEPSSLIRNLYHIMTP